MKAPFILSLLFIVYTSCSDDITTIEKPVAIDTQLKYQYSDMGVAFEGMDKTQLLQGKHSSWTHANVAYDKSLNKFVVFYDIKEGHTLGYNRVAMRFKEPEGGFSNLLVVADRMSNPSIENISCKTQASGIAKNGDYISLVAHFENSLGAYPPPMGTSIYRSSYKGKS